MKPSLDSSSPRGLTCQLVRLWSSVCRGDATPPQHARSCEHCRQFFHSIDQLTGALQQSAAREAVAVPTTLEARIIHAVRASAQTSERRRSRAWTFAFAGGAAALVGVSIWSLSLRQVFGPRPDFAHEYANDVAELVTAVRALPSQLRSTLEVPAVEITQNSPLEREAQGVVSDARSALDFLALNFLPSGQTREINAVVDSHQRT